jgi:hypothetical protein
MGVGKLILHLCYVFFGVYLVWVYPLKIFASHADAFLIPKNLSGRYIKVLSGLVLLGALLLLPLTYFLPCLILSVYIGHKTPNTKYQTSAIFLGLLISSFTAFWMHNSHNRLSISLLEAAQFFSITAFFYWILERRQVNILSLLQRRVGYFFLSLGFGIALVYLSLQTGTNIQLDSFYQWHHWSAYIGQAELLVQGIVPFNDIPLQYGLGPISLIALACKSNCWIALYWIASVMAILFTILIALLGLKLSKARSMACVGTVLLLALFTALLWPPYQNGILSISTFPSVSAMRFLPSLLMLSALIFDPLKNTIGIFSKPLTTLLLLMLWLLAFAWSPEAGIQSSIVWMPYYIWNRAKHQQGFKLFGLMFVAALELSIAFALGIVFMSACFFSLFKEWPQLSQYLTYLHSLPGAPEKVNSNGLIWYVIACCGIWLYWIRGNRSRLSQLSVWLVALLCFANFTYFLSHNHDSVIADLSPYFLLLLLAIYGHSQQSALRSLISMVIAGCIGWTSLMVGLGTIFTGVLQDAQSPISAFFSAAPHKLIDQFNRETQDPFSFIPRSAEEKLKSAELNQALQYLHRQFHEPVEVFDQWMLINAQEVYPPWNGFHGPVTSSPLPPSNRDVYLERVAKKLQRSGWILFDKDFAMDDYLRNYDSAYSRTKELDFPHYHAIRYEPKQVK